MGKGALLYRTLRSLLGPVIRRRYQLETKGLESFPMKGPVILAANHVSFMDSLWIPVSVPRRVVYLAKAEYFDSWKSAWFFRALGMIPIDRSSGQRAESALSAATQLLQSGGVLGVYPEGTRSPDGRLYRGRTGVGRLVLRTGVSVVPVGIRGSRDVMPKGARLPKRSGRVSLHFGKPVAFERYTGHKESESVVRAITDEIMFQIMALSGQEYVDQYASNQATQVGPEDFRPPSDEMLG